MKLLITGGSGFLGSRIVSAFSQTDTCLAPAHRELDITNFPQCQAVLETWQPDLVIHTAAASDVQYCELHPDLSYAANVLGPINLAAACRESGCRLIFMSSDQVYASNHTALPNSESDACHPQLLYGKQKLEAEQRILEHLPEDAVCLRLSWMYDLFPDGRPGKPNFLTRLMDASAQSPISFSDSEYRGITWVWEVVQNLRSAFSLPAGIYNFGCSASDTTYRLAMNTLPFLQKGADISELVQIREDVPPRSLAMTQDKLRAFQITFSDNLEGIKRCLDYYKR